MQGQQIEDTWTWSNAQKMGYISKGDTWEWTPSDDKKLTEVLGLIAKDDTELHVKTIYYWISHYHFDGKISKKCIEARVDYLGLKMLAKNDDQHQ